MGLSNQIPASRLIQPGVCTSLTRPASPFEGQAIFETDTDRMLIWNGTTWVMPNQTTQNPTGLELITTGTLSGTSKDFTNCFPTQYTNFRIVLDNLQMSSPADLYFQMLSGSTPSTTNDYTYAIYGYNVAATLGGATNGGTSAGYLGFTSSGANNTVVGAVTCDFMHPNIAQRTMVLVHAVSYPTNWAYRFGMSHHNLTTAYDGLRFTTLAAPTMGGNVSVYGYRK